MPGHHRGAVEDNDLIGAQQGPQPGTDEPCRHGVVGLPDADPRVPVDSRGQRGPGLERLTRQRPQQRCLEREVGGDTDRAALQTAVVVGRVGGRDQGVELGDRVHPGHRDQVVAAEPAALDLDPALLVGALLARAAVEGVEPVVGPEGDPLAGLHPSAAEQHPSDRRLEVVVADVDHRHPAQLGERVHMAFQEGLLALRLERPVHRLARERAPQREQEHLGLRPAVDDPQVGEVDLGLRAWLVHLRDVDLLRRPARLGPDLRPAHVHVVPHRRVRDLGQLVLLDQPGMDPPRGMPLLARRSQVLPQHAVDQRLGRVQPRRRPHRHLPRRWLGRPQRLPDRPTVHPVPVGQPPDRQLLPPGIPTDRLEQLHPRPHPPALPHPRADNDAEQCRWGHARPSQPPRRVDKWGQIKPSHRPPHANRWGQIRPSGWGPFRLTDSCSWPARAGCCSS